MLDVSKITTVHHPQPYREHLAEWLLGRSQQQAGRRHEGAGAQKQQALAVLRISSRHAAAGARR